MRDTPMPSRLSVLAVSFALACMFMAGSAVGHDDHDWIRAGGFRSPSTAEWCCGKDDCVMVPAVDVEAAAPGWLIRTTGETVPYHETLPSQDGHFWRCHRPNGSRRCFFAPPGTS